MSMEPAAGGAKPQTMLLNLDLPAPFSPTRTTISPRPTEKLASFSTQTPE
jgi:hypothetical protein